MPSARPSTRIAPSAAAGSGTSSSAAESGVPGSSVIARIGLPREYPPADRAHAPGATPRRTPNDRGSRPVVEGMTAPYRADELLDLLHAEHAVPLRASG